MPDGDASTGSGTTGSSYMSNLVPTFNPAKDDPEQYTQKVALLAETWPSDLTTTSLEVQINRQPKSFEAHIDWQPNHLNLKSIDNQINWISNQSTTKIIWISNQMTTKSFDSQLVWIWHQLTFEKIELRRLPSYRFLIFGNFRHRLAR